VKYQLTEEILLLQKRAGIITESEYQERLSEVDIDLDDKEQFYLNRFPKFID